MASITALCYLDGLVFRVARVAQLVRVSASSFCVSRTLVVYLLHFVVGILRMMHTVPLHTSGTKGGTHRENSDLGHWCHCKLVPYVGCMRRST